MGLAWGVGFYLTQYLFEKNNEDSSTLLKLYFGLFVSAWVGAKLFFLLFSSQNKVEQYLYADYFWFGGGFVFYGGLLVGLSFYLIYSLFFKKFDFDKSYLLIPGLIFGHAIGRVGCFLTGCCYGNVCDLPWKVFMNGEYRHPVQLYEAIALTFLGILSLYWIKGKRNLFVFTNYLLCYSLIRFVLEFFRGDDVRGVFLYQLSTSQYISIGLFFVASSIRIFCSVKK